MPLVVASWNVNSLRARADLVGRFLDERAPDVLCLQETRVADAAFPRNIFEQREMVVATEGHGGRAGVAIASRHPLEHVEHGFAGTADGDGRRLAVRTAGIDIETVYVPTRRAIGKVAFFERLAALRAARDPTLPFLLCGDFNVCFDERDVHRVSTLSDPEDFTRRPEDLAFRRLVDQGLADLFRLHTPGGGHYSWFDLRPWTFSRNVGMRLDYAFASAPLAARCTGAEHDREPRTWPRPSDHLPLIVTFDRGAPN
jgi:exodeoxyribonuclease III